MRGVRGGFLRARSASEGFLHPQFMKRSRLTIGFSYGIGRLSEPFPLACASGSVQAARRLCNSPAQSVIAPGRTCPQTPTLRNLEADLS